MNRSEVTEYYNFSCKQLQVVTTVFFAISNIAGKATLKMIITYGRSRVEFSREST